MNALMFRVGAAVVVAVVMVTPAWAAKGTIRSVEPGFGSIVVSDVSGSSVTPGKIIFFSSEPLEPSLRIGDVVNFNIEADPPSATNVTWLSEGTVIAQDHSGTVTVGPDQSVVITGGATIDGKISVNGGTLLVLDGVIVDGKIEGSNGACVYIEGAGKIDGKIESTGGVCLTVTNSMIEGKISSNGDVYVRIVGNTIKGKLEVRNNGPCIITSNTVDGKVNVPNCQTD
jgi:hypothetical protein